MKPKFLKTVVLKGSEKAAPKAKKLKGIDKKELLTVTVKLRAKEALPDLLNPDVYEKFTPISREEFAAKYGSTEEDIQKVTDYAQHAGLSLGRVDAAKKTVKLVGTIAQMEAAFGVTLNNYTDAKKLTFRGRTGDIKIPAELDKVVEGIFGLDNRPVASPKFVVKKTAKIKKATLAAAATPPPYFPTDIAKAYNFPQNATGKNQCIGIIELGGGFKTADLDNYFAKMNLATPNVIAVSVDGAHNNPTNANSADGEVLLDIEVAGGIAPDTTIVVYFAPNSNQGFLDAINAAIHDTTYKPSVISISWGSAEGTAGGWTSSSLTAYNQAFQAASTLGVTVCAAAGDNGSRDNVNDGKVHVDFPSSSPYVLACGGTYLTTGSDGSVSSEVVWHESDGGATGGGVSDVFALPAYQKKSKVPKSLNTKKAGRGVPDIAGDADPNSGYEIIVDGVTAQIGGTSAVAPMMAGLLSLINELKNAPAGFIHPKLYANPSVCRDIKKGNNKTAGTKGYAARKGWDACTGNGVPDGTKLAAIL